MPGLWHRPATLSTRRRKIIPPGILGHELCGRVIESRAPDATTSVGDRVVMYIVIVHGGDRYVEMGRENLTTHRTTMSYHHDGALGRGLSSKGIECHKLASINMGVWAHRDRPGSPTRHFCEACGVHLTARSEWAPAAVLIKVGTLDDPSV